MFEADMTAEEILVVFRDMIVEHWAGTRLTDLADELETLLAA